MGLFVDGGELNKLALSDEHTRGLNKVAMLRVVFETRAFEIYAPLPVAKDVSTDDTSNS